MNISGVLQEMGKNTFYGIPKRTFHKPFWKSLSFVLWMRCKQMMCLVAKRREWLDMYVLSLFSLQVQRWQVTLVFGAVLEKNSWTCFFTQLVLITTVQIIVYQVQSKAVWQYFFCDLEPCTWIGSLLQILDLRRRNRWSGARLLVILTMNLC